MFRGLASRDGLTDVLPRLQPIIDLVHGNPDATLGDAYAAGEHILRQHYRNEYVYKNDLISRIIFGRHSPRTASALLEVPMGRSCADLMVVNGTSTIYEIKTDLDDFHRLASQLTSYATRAEFVNVVVGEKKATRAAGHLPENVGLIVASQGGSMSTIRPARSNLDLLDLDHLYQLLRVDEAAALLERTTGYVADIPRGHSWKRMRELFSELDRHQAHHQVVTTLKTRGTLAADLVSRPNYPASLRALAYGASLNPTSAERTMRRLTAHPATLE
ncbi:sce7726 family protein [Nocardioides sp.]|uniref:sce7726 family protein n=1 Tax=Nocardioides sp. TaxID=35761 RepID=UPI00271FEC0E|nr:sce7726 family protein [Nocardioides sp.]MDO9455230.1 sce7726 family protein [Nocardioides sp.]